MKIQFEPPERKHLMPAFLFSLRFQKIDGDISTPRVEQAQRTLWVN
jgi:hypothetical protein